jgi:hypothetical protein
MGRLPPASEAYEKLWLTPFRAAIPMGNPTDLKNTQPGVGEYSSVHRELALSITPAANPNEIDTNMHNRLEILLLSKMVAKYMNKKATPTVAIASGDVENKT